MVVLIVDIVMGSHQHPGHQDHEFIKGDLSISISIQFLEYFVNGGLIFGVLGEGDSRHSELRPSPFLILRAQLREARGHSFIGQNCVGECHVTKQKAERGNHHEPS